MQKIFYEYLHGKGSCEIAAQLNNEKVLPPQGAAEWYSVTIEYILSNEKYIGDSLLQKKYTTDEMPFALKINRGERQQYYIKNTHEAIIDEDTFYSAQKLTKQRAEKHCTEKIIKKYPLRRKIVNGKIYWVCRLHDKISAEKCNMKAIPETEIYSAFIRLQNKLAANCKNILSPLLRQLRELSDKGISGNAQIAEIRKEIADVKNQRHLMAKLKSQGILDAAYYTEHSSQLDRKLLSLQNQLHSLMGNDEDDEEIDGIKLLISFFENAEPITEFDEILFGQVVEKITVRSSTELTFRLAGGVEFTEHIRRKERRGK